MGSREKEIMKTSVASKTYLPGDTVFLYNQRAVVVCLVEVEGELVAQVSPPFFHFGKIVNFIPV